MIPEFTAPSSFSFRRWMLVFLMAALALFQIVSALRVLQLPEARPPLDVAAGILWGGVFALAALRLVQKRQGAGRFALWTMALFAAYSTLRVSIFARADYDRGRLPFLITMVGLWIAFLVLYEVRSRRNARATEYT
jgi:hypothetical protein